MAILGTKGQGWRAIPTQYRKASDILTSTLWTVYVPFLAPNNTASNANALKDISWTSVHKIRITVQDQLARAQITRIRVRTCRLMLHESCFSNALTQRLLGFATANCSGECCLWFSVLMSVPARISISITSTRSLHMITNDTTGTVGITIYVQ